MKKFLVIAALLALCSSAAFAQVTTNWDFNDWGTQGWTIAGNAGAGLTVPWGTYMEAGYDPAMYLPDKAYAWINVNPTNSFVFSADVMFNATNRLQACGLGYHYLSAGGDPWKINAWYEGKASNSSEMIFKDSWAPNTVTQGLSGSIKDSSGNTWAGMAMRLTIDFNYSQAGKVVLSCEGLNYTPYAGQPASFVYNRDLAVDPLTSSVYAIDAIRLGGEYSWTQAYFDDVTFTDYAAVPEPGSIVALASGLVGLAGFGIRRRK